MRKWTVRGAIGFLVALTLAVAGLAGLNYGKVLLTQHLLGSVQGQITADYNDLYRREELPW